ncbi:MAG: glycosyltransferase family 4 protein [Pyrinomonadaceae bacterium]|nr:glycosyltransferase family 4 protein [Pyrinomonadaceae bacterium]
MPVQAILTFAVAFVVAWCVTRVAIPVLRNRGLLDLPNARSSHAVPTPRGGGVGIVAGLLAGLGAAALVGSKIPGAELFLGIALIAAVGFIDDHLGGLPVLLRLATQFAAAGLIVWGGGAVERLPLPDPLNFELSFFAVPFSLLWIVAVLNLYNFLDGIDGFAGLQGVVAGLGIALWGQGEVAAVGLAVAGACAGFLPHNWHPAKVFMGDVGSGTLGFALAAVPFQSAPASRGDAVLIVAMCLWFFLSDGVFTILRRLVEGQRVWQAHRSHLYQRLVQAGLRHDRVVLKVTGAGAVFATLTVVAVRTSDASARWGVLTAAGAAFLGYYFWTTARERTFQTPRTSR